MSGSEKTHQFKIVFRGEATYSKPFDLSLLPDSPP